LCNLLTSLTDLLFVQTARRHQRAT